MILHDDVFVLLCETAHVKHQLDVACVELMHRLTDWPCVLANVLADGPRSLAAAAATANMVKCVRVEGVLGPLPCTVDSILTRHSARFHIQPKVCIFSEGVSTFRPILATAQHL